MSNDSSAVFKEQATKSLNTPSDNTNCLVHVDVDVVAAAVVVNLSGGKVSRTSWVGVDRQGLRSEYDRRLFAKESIKILCWREKKVENMTV